MTAIAIALAVVLVPATALLAVYLERRFTSKRLAAIALRALIEHEEFAKGHPVVYGPDQRHKAIAQRIAAHLAWGKR